MIGGAIRHRQLVFYFLMVIFIAGIYSYITLPKQEAPDISPTVAMVTAIYPGASQYDVDEFVTSKIEKSLMDMEEFDYCNSYTYNSVTTVVVFMKYGYETEPLWNKLRRELDDLQEELPDEVQPLLINTDMTETAGMIISLTGESHDYESLGFYGQSIVDELKKVDGVNRFEIIGEVEKEVRITVNGSELNRLNMSYGELSQLLQGQNLEIPSGSLETEGESINLLVRGSFESLDDIRNIVIGVSTDNYSVLKLGEVATIEMVDEEAPTLYLRDGRQAVLLIGYFEDNKNVLAVGDDVREEIDEIKGMLPEDLIFEEVIYQPTEVENAINGFMWNLLLGIGLVILVVFIGMGFRNAIIVSLAIPTSILSTLAIMPIFDIKIHAISITAFIVALGMLVDNAIVVSDAIQYKLDHGMERMEACVKGTKEVIISILTSTLTTVAAFSPLMMLNSVAVDYVKALPQVVIIALTASFFFACLATPSLAYVFFEKRSETSLGKKKTFMQELLELGLRRKFVAFTVGMLVIALLGSSFALLNIIFFPKTDKTIMYIDIKAEKNIDAAFTKTVTDQIDGLLAEEEGVVHYTTAIGGALPKYYDTLGIYTAIPENAQVVMEIDLSQTEFVKNSDYGAVLQKKIDEVLVGGKATVKELEYAEPISSPVYIKITGGDMDELWSWASQFQLELEQIPGAANVRTDYNPYVYEYEVVLEDQKLSYYGLMKYDVLNEVSIALRGREVTTFRKNGEEYAVTLTSDSNRANSIENLMVKSTATGNKHLLKDIGELSLTRARPSIRKYNGELAIILMADLEAGYDSGSVEQAFKASIQDWEMGDIELTYDGESSKIGVYFGNLGFSAVFAVVMIFTILLVQFKNYRQALIVLLTLPLSAAGAMFGLFIMDQPVSFTGMIGIISLIGIVVNNAIVLMEFINLERSEGMSVDEAAVNASVVRFRPIILSTVTTVTGLLPLMFSNSELFKPMAVTLVFGLLVSTFLTLVFIPLTYAVVYHEASE